MYFAALLARTEDGWEASDTELDDVEALSDLTDLARDASVDEDTVLVYIEQEDAWFGVVRVDGEEDPRIYVSDAAAAARSSYGEILLTDELLGREPGAEDEIAALEELVGLEDDEADDPEFGHGDDDGATARRAAPVEADDDPDAVPAGPIGDASILADLGLSEQALLTLRTDALAEIADALGADEVLESVR
ncbi:tRNA adenosine deaminase-associated protein [Streptomyces sp. NPDC001493]